MNLSATLHATEADERKLEKQLKTANNNIWYLKRDLQKSKADTKQACDLEQQWEEHADEQERLKGLAEARVTECDFELEKLKAEYDQLKKDSKRSSSVAGAEADSPNAKRQRGELVPAFGETANLAVAVQPAPAWSFGWPPGAQQAYEVLENTLMGQNDVRAQVRASQARQLEALVQSVMGSATLAAGRFGYCLMFSVGCRCMCVYSARTRSSHRFEKNHVDDTAGEHHEKLPDA